MKVNDKTQHAIACATFVAGIYAIFCGGTVASGQPMPDGELFFGVLVLVGFVFGFSVRGVVDRK